MDDESAENSEVLALIDELRHGVASGSVGALYTAHKIVASLESSDIDASLDSSGLRDRHKLMADSGRTEEDCRGLLKLLQNDTRATSVVEDAFSTHLDTFPDSLGARTLLVQWQLRCLRVQEAAKSIATLVQLKPDWMEKRLEQVKHSALQGDMAAQAELDAELKRVGLVISMESELASVLRDGRFGGIDPAGRFIARASRANRTDLAMQALDLAESTQEVSPRLYGDLGRNFSMAGDVAAVKLLIDRSPYGANDDGGNLLFSLACAYENCEQPGKAADVFAYYADLPRFSRLDARRRYVAASLAAGRVHDAVALVKASKRNDGMRLPAETIQRVFSETVRTDPLLAGGLLAEWPEVRLNRHRLESVLTALVDTSGAQSAVEWLVHNASRVKAEEWTWATLLDQILFAGEDVCHWLGASHLQAEKDQLRVVKSLKPSHDEGLLMFVFPRYEAIAGTAQNELARHAAARVNEADADRLAAWQAVAEALAGRTPDVVRATLCVAVSDRLTVERRADEASKWLDETWDWADDKALLACPPTILQSWVRATRWACRDSWEGPFDKVLEQLFRIHDRQRQAKGHAAVVRMQQAATMIQALVETYSELNRVGRFGAIDKKVRRLNRSQIAPTPVTLESLMVALPRESRVNELDRVRSLLEGKPLTAGLWTTFVAGALAIPKLPAELEPTPEAVRENVARTIKLGEELMLKALSELKSSTSLNDADRAFSRGELLRIADSYPSNRYKAYGPLPNDVRSKLSHGLSQDDAFAGTIEAISSSHARYGLVDGVRRMCLALEIKGQPISRAVHVDLAEAASREDNGDSLEGAVRAVASQPHEWSLNDLQRLLRLFTDLEVLRLDHIVQMLGDASLVEMFPSALTSEIRRASLRRTAAAADLIKLADRLRVHVPDALRLGLLSDEGTGGMDASPDLDVGAGAGASRPDSLSSEQFRNFQGLISHITAVPASAIINSLRTLGRATPSDEDTSHRIEMTIDGLRTASSRLSRLRRMLTIGERDDSGGGATLLSEVIDSVLGTFSDDFESSSITVERDLDDRWTTETNAGLVAFLIENLVSNSVKQGALLKDQGRIPPGGFRIIVATSYRPPDEDDVGRYGTVTIGVRDNGSGLPQGLMDDIRTWNYTSQPDHGLGIGLRSAAEGADLAGGRISAIEVPTGAWMAIALPAGKPQK